MPKSARACVPVQCTQAPARPRSKISVKLTAPHLLTDAETPGTVQIQSTSVDYTTFHYGSSGTFLPVKGA
ncbi:hypothetical protein QFZ49_004384 [Streptomyces turgidiscabies]|uniref:Uncharacterized protein n=1 Tax=Streptomyces turgidiscabies TaxID=85558 RepID=A0ABU0RR26_9ACTN|nr:hypothetical protein [Streptomyces turgidiscabies]